MNSGRPPEQRRGVPRGYVGALTAAVTIVGLALVVASWGVLSYLIGREPVQTPGVWVAAAEVIVLVALALLAWGLWLQALVLLRGRRTPPWAHTVVLALGGYFVWCLGGILAGLGIDETWLSPFALALALAWGLCSILFWAVLARRVYTNRPTPKWPWERRGEVEGPDWVTPGAGYGNDRDDEDRDGYDRDDERGDDERGGGEGDRR